MPADALAIKDWNRIEALAREAAGCAADAWRRCPRIGLTHLRVTLSETVYIGPGRADLLELIAETGSISAAGKAHGHELQAGLGAGAGAQRGLRRAAGRVQPRRRRAGRGAADRGRAGSCSQHYRAMQDKTRAAIADDVAALRLKFDMSGRK